MHVDVIAVIVTRNRLGLLKGAIDHLLEQTFPLKKIIIVDNASDDGTAEYLNTIKSETIESIFLQTNEGGAGGFYRGIKSAYETGCDAVWIMDDDTYTTDTALEEIIDSFLFLKSKNRRVGFITSNALFKDEKPCFMNCSHTVYDWNEYAREGLIRVSHSSFVSMFIPTTVIADLGYPIKEFFIWGDDGEYSTRIARKYEGYICAKSIVYHMMSENVGVDIFNTPADRINRFYYFYRNWMFTNQFRSKNDAKWFVSDSKYTIKNILKSGTNNKIQKIKAIRKGIHDGKRFDAHIELVDGSYLEKTKEPSINLAPIYGKVKSANRLVCDKVGKVDVGYVNFIYERYLKTNPSKIRKNLFWLRAARKGSVVYGQKEKADNFWDLMENVLIDTSVSNRFFMSLDCYRNWGILPFRRQMDNCPVDYYLFVNNGLKDLIIDGNDTFSEDCNKVINSLIMYIGRANKAINKSHIKNKREIIKWLTEFIEGPASTLEAALQRVTLISQVLWQTGHFLVGFGRLDYILDEFIKKDTRSDEEIVDLLIDFLKVNHNYYWYKSSALMGDTGQAIILGGVNKDGSYFENRLTLLFIKAVEKCGLPDPKIVLRVSSSTSDAIWDASFKCISTGIGCPLFANDERVIPALLKNGYCIEDANNYVTSACWEPIAGNSCEQNNLENINYTAPFELLSSKEMLSDYDSFESYYQRYLYYLREHSEYVVKLLDNIVWDKDPLMSSMMVYCRENHKDISEGGGKYNNYGLLTVGLSNAINALCCIKELVFEKKLISLRDLENARISNFSDKTILATINNVKSKFGHDSPDIIKMTKELTETAHDAISGYTNMFGGHAKMGTSSPSYLMIGKWAGATYDGRLANMPYATHLSADGGVPYTEFIGFVGNIDYNKIMNGNVLDLMVSPEFMSNNKDVFKQLFKSSIKGGWFEAQFNVVSSKVLKEAKADPSSHPNLIVRVWGFSSYFNELPEEYKDYLIIRAENNEASNS